MFQRHFHRHDDIDLVMSALGDDPQCLPVLITWGAGLRRDVASSLREVIATGAWQSDFSVRSAAAHWREEPRFQVFLDHGLEKRRNRGPRYEHLDAALLTFPETRAALYRVAAQCPQHCRTQTGTFAEDRHVDDYREALVGWYAAIQHAHACVVRAARWFADAQLSDSRRPGTFTDWMSGTRRRHSSGTAEETAPAAQRALQEIILMMHAWSPYTFEAIDVAFQKAEGEAASHAWGGSFEPAAGPKPRRLRKHLRASCPHRNASRSGRHRRDRERRRGLRHGPREGHQAGLHQRPPPHPRRRTRRA
ncbi:hypothetical protein ACGFW5_24490 [Streptomyces sp. NPDC048416]|uniref:hypothetical protein n=1 Tax=Streptomyces sp. NPDC048416 TaxID=3365546 RepID=UPI0037136A1D